MIEFRPSKAVVVAALAATFASGAQAGSEDEVSAAEYILLPRFCWYQFSGGKVTDVGTGPNTTMTNCGPHMNHYCNGLLDLQRSKRTSDLAMRKILLGRARGHTNYTLNGMKSDGTLGTCSITSHVQATLREIDLQMQIYSIKK